MPAPGGQFVSLLGAAATPCALVSRVILLTTAGSVLTVSVCPHLIATQAMN